MKVRLLYSPSESQQEADALESQVNEFIADKQVIDIKVSVASRERCDRVYVLVLYE